MALCKWMFRSPVCGVSVNTFALIKVFGSFFELNSFVGPQFQISRFDDHETFQKGKGSR